MEVYLRCTEIIDCDTGVVKDKAQELTSGLQVDKDKAIALYYFVRDEIKHNAYAPLHDPGRYKASATLHDGNGFCQQKAILLVALARAIGIPARVGLIDVRDHLISDRFREMIGGINIYDIEICRRKRFVPVEFDGVNDAKDSPYDLDGRPHVEHIKYHGPYEDFPWDDILKYYMEWSVLLGREWGEFKQAGEQVRQSKLQGET